MPNLLVRFLGVYCLYLTGLRQDNSFGQALLVKQNALVLMIFHQTYLTFEVIFEVSHALIPLALRTFGLNLLWGFASLSTTSDTTTSGLILGWFIHPQPPSLWFNPGCEPPNIRLIIAKLSLV